MTKIYRTTLSNKQGSFKASNTLKQQSHYWTSGWTCFYADRPLQYHLFNIIRSRSFKNHGHFKVMV